MADLQQSLRNLMKPAPKPTTGENIARIGLGAMMSWAGTSHLTFARKDFQAQVPDWFPMDKDFVVLSSGVVELAFGTALLALPKYRKAIGTGLAALYVAIFPGNVSQYAERHDAFGLDTDRKRLIRLFGQPALVAAALKAAGLPNR
ncbi:DoxX family protein [Corynebacterium heidelbergense]|uniref:DoxX family protein n=1 Tax=Corynebacterium heidelbergense TaxID=2055947 RepID=UPI00269F2FB2